MRFSNYFSFILAYYYKRKISPFSETFLNKQFIFLFSNFLYNNLCANILHVLYCLLSCKDTNFKANEYFLKSPSTINYKNAPPSPSGDFCQYGTITSRGLLYLICCTAYSLRQVNKSTLECSSLLDAEV